MRTYIQEGRHLAIPAAPYQVASGEGVQVGSLFGIASARLPWARK